MQTTWANDGASGQGSCEASHPIVGSGSGVGSGAKTANRTKIGIWTCNRGWNQVWRSRSNGELVNPHSGKCLDDPGFRTRNGTQLEIWTCNDGTNQRCTLP